VDRQKLGKAGTFILGGVAGAVAGILIAPRSGRELRGAVSSRAGEARERGREGYFEARERARERLAGMREPRLADEDTREMHFGPSGETPAEESPREEAAAPEPTQLRAVPPQETPAEEPAPAGEDQDPEALRRRIRQTRERLRRREPGGGADG
jgi:hypothetical protein